MEEYEVLAEDFGDVQISEYDPTIYSPRGIVARDQKSYGIEEPEDEEVIEDILEAVDEAKKEAEESGAEFYNGPLIRLMDYEVEDGTLDIDIQNTNYFTHAGTRERPELGKENRADPLSVGAVVRTADDNIVLGERSGLVELGEGEYQLAGAGFIEDPERQYERSLNAESSSPIHRELEEEINLDYTQLTGPEPSALIGAVHRQPMLIYDTETVLDSEEVANEWADIPEDEREFSQLLFVPEEDSTDILEEGEVMRTNPERPSDLETTEFSGSLRPHAKGALDALN
jgi:hypothetical protein